MPACVGRNHVFLIGTVDRHADAPFFGVGGRRVVPENAEWQPEVFAAGQSLLPAISPCDIYSKPVR